MRRFLFLSLIISAFAEVPDGLPGCSGMAAWGPDRYVVCRDFKSGESGIRLALLETSPRVRYQALEVNWGKSGEANDLEAITPLQGKPNEFLAVEAEPVNGFYGRIFHLRWEEQAFEVEATYDLPDNLGQEIEGLASRRLSDGHWMILLGGRRGKQGQPGRLFWADLKGGQLNWSDSGRIGVDLRTPRRLGPFARTVSDMYVDEQDSLYISCCSSPGKAGPNRSLIYRAGKINPQADPPLEFSEPGERLWWMDGVKIEGLAPCSRPGYGPAYITEDNDLGGIWRAVPLHPSQRD